MRRITVSRVVAPAVVLFASSLSYAAEPDDASETAAARGLAVDGIKLAQAGNCDEAVSKLTRAEELHHSPIVLGRLGECLVNVGRVVEGTEALRRMLREQLPENPTPALSQAYEHASQVLEAAKPKIAALNVVLEANGATQPSLKVDGKPIASALLGADLPADPGQHVVTAYAAGYFDATQRVTVDAGGRQTLVLKLIKDPKYVEKAEPRAASTAKKAASEPNAGPLKPPVKHEEPNHVPAYLSWAVGAAGVGVGVYFGVKAMNAKDSLVNACPANTCDPSHDHELKTAKTQGNIATISVGVGALGLVLGTIFYAAAGSSDEPEKVGTFRVGGVTARASLGAGSVGLSGAF